MPMSVQRKIRTGRVFDRGTSVCVERRNSTPLASEMHAASAARMMEARRRCCQVAAMTKKAESKSANREKIVRKKEIALAKSRSTAESQDDSGHSLQRASPLSRV
jgi:hypothetical protein